MGRGRSWIEMGRRGKKMERKTEKKRETERPCLESSPVFNRM